MDSVTFNDLAGGFGGKTVSPDVCQREAITVCLGGASLSYDGTVFVNKSITRVSFEVTKILRGVISLSLLGNSSHIYHYELSVRISCLPPGNSR